MRNIQHRHGIFGQRRSVCIVPPGRFEPALCGLEMCAVGMLQWLHNALGLSVPLAELQSVGKTGWRAIQPPTCQT